MHWTPSEADIAHWRERETVDCPDCHAPAGRACVGLSGPLVGKFLDRPHAMRGEAWEKAQEKREGSAK